MELMLAVAVSQLCCLFILFYVTLCLSCWYWFVAVMDALCWYVGERVDVVLVESEEQVEQLSQQLQVVCPVDAYPGKQIAIQTPDGQTLNVIVPRSVMPGMPFNVLYTPVVQQPQNKSPANQPKRSTPRHTIRVAVNAPVQPI